MKEVVDLEFLRLYTQLKAEDKQMIRNFLQKLIKKEVRTAKTAKQKATFAALNHKTADKIDVF